MIRPSAHKAESMMPCRPALRTAGWPHPGRAISQFALNQTDGASCWTINMPDGRVDAVPTNLIDMAQSHLLSCGGYR